MHRPRELETGDPVPLFERLAAAPECEGWAVLLSIPALPGCSLLGGFGPTPEELFALRNLKETLGGLAKTIESLSAAPPVWSEVDDDFF